MVCCGVSGDFETGWMLAVDLQRGRETGGDKEVRALLFDQQLEQLVNEACCAFAFHRVISCLSRAWIGYAGA